MSFLDETGSIHASACSELEARGGDIQQAAESAWYLLPRTHAQAAERAEVDAHGHMGRLLARLLDGQSTSALRDIKAGARPPAFMALVDSIERLNALEREAWLTWYCDIRLSHHYWTRALAQQCDFRLPGGDTIMPLPLEWRCEGHGTDYEWRLEHARKVPRLLGRWSGASIAEDRGVAEVVPMEHSYYRALRRIVDHVWPGRL